MDITIHYEFRLNTLLLKHVRKILKELREHALILPFKEVGEIVELTDDECDPEFYEVNGNKYRRLKVQLSTILLKAASATVLYRSISLPFAHGLVKGAKRPISVCVFIQKSLNGKEERYQQT